ncbi:succinyldiaminopimelate transaminase [Sulfurospirillum arcachonense]|uniref:succinyldiaminopimelate transaminase n=1 Tax=Sulfurospirillum arcachonense TaxID=57666 RepID=UPI00046A1B6C|nr:succinyldiaminopimelate transaminase [Sulfurospirillum arcachonense]
MNFEPYPFEKLTNLLKNVEPTTKYEPAVLTIGEPQFETPLFIQESLKDNASLLNKYPKTVGEEYLKDAQKSFVKKRFGVALNDTQIIPTFGTREVLFNFPQFLLHDIKEPVMAYPNPFYQIYEGAATACKAKVVHLNLIKENGFKPDINHEQLKEANLVILNFPNNPTASTLSLEELGGWVKLALKYDFVLLNDECYSEIYCDEKPICLLEASLHVKNHDFKNVLVVNSISKRSSAPGLRSGFIAGDESILTEYMKYRTYIGAASPLPLQCAAAAAWNDELHVSKAREVYKKNLELASQILHVKKSEATFYVWLEVKDELEFTKKLYEKKNVKVLPGSFLGREGIGSAYVRIALVENSVKTEKVLNRIKDFIKEEEII